MDIKPSAGCVNSRCIDAQKAYQVRQLSGSFACVQCCAAPAGDRLSPPCAAPIVARQRPLSPFPQPLHPWQARINTPEARAAAAAVATAAAAAAAEGPLHEENEWGIEVVADEEPTGEAAGGAVASAAQALPEGVEFSMPAGGGVDAATLRTEGVGTTDASLDELTGMLAALGGGTK
jgi:hypothetical protein